jgi:hypothetical protein
MLIEYRQASQSSFRRRPDPNTNLAAGMRRHDEFFLALCRELGSRRFNTFGTIRTFGTTETNELIGALALRPMLSRAALAGKISRRVD